MKKILITLIVLGLAFSLANAQTGFRVTFTPLYSDSYANDFLGSGEPFTVKIYHTNSQMRTGWSTPFVFYGTGTVNLTGPGTHAADPAFAAIWTMGTFEAEESWDGDIQNNAGGLTGDLWNYSGLTLSGYMPGPELLAFTFNFTMIPDPADDETTVMGQFCVDSGDFVDNTYDWLFDPPEPFGGPFCVDVKKKCILPPVITNCPSTDLSLQWDEQLAYQFEPFDPEGTGVFYWSVVSGPGEINQDGFYTYNPDCSEVGSHTVVIEICDEYGGCTQCEFTVTVLNTAPVIGGDCGETFTARTNYYNASLLELTVTDANVGDAHSWYVAGITPDDGNLTVIHAGGGIYDVECYGESGIYVVTICVVDCAGDIDCCDVWLEVIPTLPMDILIEKAHNQFQGHHSYIDVKKMCGAEAIHGFDFLIGYDASALTFIGAEQGQVLTDLEWEYFTYRYNWNGNCGSACPSGLLRVVAMGETNDGPHHPLGFFIPDGEALFTMDFLVTNDRNFGCMFVPIYFYWMDCGDNTIAFHNATTPPNDIQTAVSEHVFQYGGTLSFYGEVYHEVTDMFFGFPTMYGVQYECLEGGGPDKPAPIPYIWLFGGGVDIICPDDIDDRGDVNLNGVSNEIADAVVFTNYFIYGLSAFVINVEGQIAATEVNGDGMVLTVADLVYLIRVIVGDALPIPKPTPAGDLQVVSGDMVTLNRDVGAAAFVFEGNADLTLAEGAAGMELISNFRDGMTYALIYTMNPGITASGDVLSVNGGNLVSVEAADYVGAPFEARILPRNFELAQNAPNPFNPTTTVSMSLPIATDFTLTVYNIAGQRVWEKKGYHEAGTAAFDIDLSYQSSGIYFYKVVAGDFNDTKKMTLIK